MTTFARAERAALSDLLKELGPEQPTLCEGWTTADLAAHLVARERRPDASLGLIIRPLRSYTERVRDSIRARPYTELVHLVATGPPKLSLFAVPGVDEAVNGMELFIHHEDVRRAQPTWEPRQLSPAAEARIWQRLRQGGRLLFRRSPVGVRLRGSAGEVVVAKDTAPSVTITGAPGELLLYAFGRGANARVELEGEEAAVQRLQSTRFRV